MSEDQSRIRFLAAEAQKLEWRLNFAARNFAEKVRTEFEARGYGVGQLTQAECGKFVFSTDFGEVDMHLDRECGWLVGGKVGNVFWSGGFDGLTEGVDDFVDYVLAQVREMS